VYTDGPTFANRILLAIAGCAAVQQTQCGWYEERVAAPGSFPQDAAIGEVFAIIVAMAHVPLGLLSSLFIVSDCEAVLANLRRVQEDNLPDGRG
jgi:hypothetical protein